MEIIEPERNDDAYNLPSLARGLDDKHQLVSERTLFGDVVMAQPTQAPRNEPRILQKIDAMASAAGENWYYRFPVKKKGGGTDFIEGISIDGADAVARYYGNCRVDCAVVDTGPAWIIYSRFCDWETGYSLIRPFLQSKTGSRLGGVDDERRLQIALSLGTSKSQRNVIDHALRDFTTRAFTQAKNDLVKRVGLKLSEYRTKCVERINSLDAPGLLQRVEQAYGRKATEWLAQDVARLIAELRAISDGMATVHETWPLPPPPEPRRDATSPAASDAAPHAAAPPSSPPTSPHSAGGEASGPAGPPADASGIPSQPAAGQPAATAANWRPNTVGQAEITKAIIALVSIATSEADLGEIEQQNADRLEKFTLHNRSDIKEAIRLKRHELAG